MATSAEEAGLPDDPPDDGYRHFALPAFGSMPGASDKQVTDICTAWWLAETAFIRRMLRGITGGAGDAPREAASIAAVMFLERVKNGNGLAGFVRDHIEGRKPIREPKAVFVSTIELHRREVLRQFIRERKRREKEEPLPPEDHSGPVVTNLRLLGGDDERDDRCLRIRVELVNLAEKAEKEGDVAPEAPMQVDAWLKELESLCIEPLHRHRVFDKLTDRERLVFLLRVEPFNEDAATAIEYAHIRPLTGILGKLASLEALRDAKRAAILRLRKFPGLKDELGYG